MAVGIGEIKDAFRVAFKNLSDPNFATTHRFGSWNERDLLVPMRFFLLGYFRDVYPELRSRVPGRKGGDRRIDFDVKGVAIELAVRQSGYPNNLTANANRSEVKKLLKHYGRAALVLFDLSGSRSLTPQMLEEYRNLPSLGSGRHNVSAFNVLYYWGTFDSPKVTRLNIRSA